MRQHLDSRTCEQTTYPVGSVIRYNDKDAYGDPITPKEGIVIGIAIRPDNVAVLLTDLQSMETWWTFNTKPTTKKVVILDDGDIVFDIVQPKYHGGHQ